MKARPRREFYIQGFESKKRRGKVRGMAKNVIKSKRERWERRKDKEGKRESNDGVGEEYPKLNEGQWS